MNPDKPSREEIEAKLTALLLGELPSEEARLLRWAIAQDAGLAKLHDQLKRAIGLVRVVSVNPAEADSSKSAALKLSDERREKLLAHFKTPRPAPKELFWLKRIEIPSLHTLAVVAVLILVVIGFTSLLTPNFIRARSTSQANSMINNMRQLDAAKSEWALETKKSPTDVPTPDDLKPYLKEFPKPVMGETYVLGRVSDPVAADVDAKQAKKQFGPLANRLPSGGTKGQLAQLSMDGNLTFVDKTSPQAQAMQLRAVDINVPLAANPASPSTVLALPTTTEIVLPKSESPPAAGSVYSATVVGYAPLPDNSSAKNDFAISSPTPAAPSNQDKRPPAEMYLGENADIGPQHVTRLVADAPAHTLPGGGSGGGGAGGFGGGHGGGGFGGGKNGLGTDSQPVKTTPADTTVAWNDAAIKGRMPDSATLERIPQADNDKTKAGTLVQDGKLLYEMGKFTEAEDKLNQALKVDPNNQGAFYYLSLDKQANYAREEQNRTTQGEVAQVAATWSPAVGAGLPVPNPNSSGALVTPTDASVALNDTDTDRSRTENQANNGWRGGVLLGPVANGGSAPAEAMSKERLPRNSFGSIGGSGDVAALQNRVVGQEQGGGARTFYRNIAGEADAEKTPALGDMPATGFAFNTSPNTPSPVVASAPASTPAQTTVFYNFAGPENLGEETRNLPKSGSGTLTVNGANTYAGESVVNAGSLSFDTPATTSGKLSSDQMITSGLRNDQNGEALKVELARRPSRQILIESTHRLDGDTINNQVPAPVVAPPALQGGVSQITLAVTNAIVVNDDTFATGLNRDDVNGLRSLLTTNQIVEEDRVAPRVSLPPPIPKPEIQTSDNAFSTFSLNVSDVSFKLAEASLQKGQMPDAASIRSEEFINAFDYRDPEAPAGQPIAFASESARYPFAHNRDLLRFSVKTAAAGRQAGRALNLVLLIDNSGSMERADRVEIIREALRVLATQLQPQDTVSIVTFARTARLWADGVSGDKAGETLEQVGGITPEGGTNLEEAMRLAYETARRHYLASGMNRVVLLTDGAANLGNVDPGALKQKVEANRKQGIALDCFGIGWEGFNDDLLEQLSSNGDGRYAFLNSPEDAANEFATKLAGALQVAASDVKVQVEFNPQRVISWRQIGYAKHQLTKEQFRDNTVDAAEIAAQEAGNALYTVETKSDGIGPVATVRVRYKVPGTMDYQERSWEVPYAGNAVSLEQSSPAMRLAATASAFSEWLASSPFAQEVTPDELLKDLSGVPQIYGADQRPKQLEWMIRQAKSLSGK